MAQRMLTLLKTQFTEVLGPKGHTLEVVGKINFIGLLLNGIIKCG